MMMGGPTTFDFGGGSGSSDQLEDVKAAEGSDGDKKSSGGEEKNKKNNGKQISRSKVGNVKM